MFAQNKGITANRQTLFCPSNYLHFHLSTVQFIKGRIAAAVGFGVWLSLGVMSV